MALVLQVVVSATMGELSALDLVELLVLRTGAASSPLLQFMVLQSPMTMVPLLFLASPVPALDMAAVATVLELVSITLLILGDKSQNDATAEGSF